ncbi:MAG: DUF3857 domain-containing protein, partial [Verrucomicrobia bacterium]|nr:DUF3857 domain-containing protein [Verrucomicrobiota bacterium]
YPDASTVLLAGIQKVRYEVDGTYTQWHEEYVKILTEEGRQGYRTLSSFFTIPYQRGPEDCAITLVEIIRPDGGVTTIDVAANSRIMVNPSSMAENIYNPNDKIVQVNVPGLKLGDVLHTVFFDRIVHPRMANTWCDWMTFESTRPIIHQIAEIDGPAALPLRSLAHKAPIANTVTYTQEEAGDRMLHRWEARDVPRAFEEPSMPEFYTVAQRVLVSTSPDWEGVSRWYWNLSEPHLVLSPEIEAKVAELTAGLTLTADKIRALFGFVAQDIRYMGIVAESESPGYEPHDVRDTFAARHGVCRDKAALLVAMLRGAGIDAFPTLINNGPKKDPEVPQPYFNHAIVAARDGDGYMLMDPTDETTRELLPAYLDNRSYLVATPEGDPLRLSAIEPATQNLLHVDTVGNVNADGRLNAETILTFAGVNDNAYRRYFAQVKPEERRRLLEGLIKAAVPNARVTDVAIHPPDMLDVSTGLTARVAYEADDVLIRGNQLVMLPLPAMGTRIGMINFIIGRTGLQDRRFPLQTEIACGVREQMFLTLAPALNTPVALPISEDIERDGVAWSFAVRQSGPTLEAVSEFRLDAVEFDPDQYRTLKQTLVTMERARRQMPMYAVANGGTDALAGDSDALTETETVDYELAADGSWREERRVRKKILTYAGKKQHAELTLRFNPAWDDLELVRGEVTSPEGQTSTISRAEMNVMDAAWVGSTPRYPAERTLVASFPAVTVGSTIDYTYVHTRRERPFVSLRESFRGTDTIRHKRVTLHMPRGVVPSVHRHLLAPARVAESIFTHGDGSRDVYEWEVQDVPGVKREEQMPPDWVLHPTVVVSFGQWRSYASGVDQALRRAAARQPVAARLARELTRKVPDPWERLQVLRDAVATRVRLVGPALPDVPLSAITPADQTLAEGYGNGADRAVLLYAMLRAAGCSAEFVLASDRPAIAPFRTSLDAAAEREVFADVLVRVDDAALDLADGRFVYLGDDDQYGAIGASAHAGMWMLTLPRGHVEELLPARDDNQWIEDSLRVEANGDVQLHRRQLLYGTSFGLQNRRYADMTPEERRRDFMETVAGLSQAAVAEGELTTDFSRYPGRIAYSVRLPQYAVRDGKQLYFSLTQAPDRVFMLRTDQRANPLFLDARGTQSARLTAHVPAGFTLVMLPEDQRLEGIAGTRVDVQVTQEPASDGGTQVIMQSEVSRTPAIVSRSDYPTLIQWDRTLSHRRARTVVLQQTDE